MENVDGLADQLRELGELRLITREVEVAPPELSGLQAEIEPASAARCTSGACSSSDGGITQNATEIEHHLDRSWRRFSWHRNVWNSSGELGRGAFAGAWQDPRVLPHR
jgi:hypothetical protein